MLLVGVWLALILSLATCNAEEAIFNPFLLTEGNIFARSHSGESYQSRAFNEFTFTQKLDHVNLFETREWEQRYFISNETYVSGTPIFLLLGGEWEANPVHIEKGYVGELANTFGAFVIYLEHRFYGKSIPLTLELENLTYLNMDQALEDTAYFTQSMKESLGLDGKWVLIGASYTGDVAAWARARYPHLYHAAYASGAPVVAQVDIPEYFEVVNQAFSEVDPNCPLVLTAAMSELKQLIDNNAAATITQLFNLVEEIDLSVEDDVTLLYFSITQFFGSLVQSAKGNSSVVVCNTLLNGQDAPLDTVAAMFRQLSDILPMRMDASLLIERYRNQTEPNPLDITRPWLYQACTELGWFTSVTSENQPFGPVVSLEFRLRFCSSVYGPEFTRERLDAGVARTNLLHGGRNPQVSRVFYTVGTLDPVSPAQMNQDLNPESPVVMLMQGISHCIDITEPTRPNEPESLKNARLLLVQTLAEWLDL